MAYPHQSTREDPSTDSGQADALGVLRRAAIWFEPNDAGFGPLLDAIDDASLVLIGEASHGTHEFYRTRAHQSTRPSQSVQHRRRRGRLAGCLSREPVGPPREPRWRRRVGARRLHALSAMDVAQSGRARLPRVASRPQRLPRARRTRRVLRSGSVQPAHVDRSSALVSAIRWIPPALPAPDIGTAASQISARTRRPTATRRPSGFHDRAKTMWSRITISARPG
jgi:hypothetical protein